VTIVYEMGATMWHFATYSAAALRYSPGVEIPLEPPRRRASRRTSLLIVLVSVLAVFAFVGLSLMENHSGSDVHGTLTAHGGELGHFTLAPNYCSSGIEAGYLGAQLMHREQRFHWYLTGSEYRQPIVRVIQNPTRGRLVSVSLPGRAKPVVLDGSHCRRFQVVVHRSHAAVSGAPGHLIDGSLDIDCDALSGSARFRKCY